ncbi:hypothetical protein BGW36DRAFT_353736 [Talaromyces proteolyticus]|uniref:Uncharacterized protein n=1 Tax=Talaromyces proteolyticus TaxID=1131652 RepID=A0AAD4L1C7_9EURO|nr:uncharacterized protein BGW36DRAFT_353736 [Talaromyces proteolyticus]KAH8705329.1 hypothetical protein BGW36DRAFT_353736 [Talaromyces proteolyticus]
MSEEDNTDIFEIFGHSFTYKTKHKSLTDPRRLSARADHPFPIRGEGLSYFEIEATNDESQDPSTTYAMIGLVGEFVELINSCPGGIMPTHLWDITEMTGVYLPEKAMFKNDETGNH